MISSVTSTRDQIEVLKDAEPSSLRYLTGTCLDRLVPQNRLQARRISDVVHKLVY